MAPSRPPLIEEADLDWTEAGEPVSRRHGDLYYSRENGLAETRHVFLDGNDLPSRFQARPGDRNHFVVAETGFGTGLNFLATAALWLERTQGDARVLHFISFERYPLTGRDLSRALQRWPELAPLARQLAEQYPPPIEGLHRLVLAGGKIRLSLYWGDALEGLNRLPFQADAWFLDGFAPARNADLWQEAILRAITAHSGPGTRLSTFTAVGAVRRGLQRLGFDMQKTAGFGRKRDMLRGRWPAPGPPTARPERTPQSVLVVGGGMAGSLVAQALASRGLPVTLLDKGPGPAAGASGNPQGALYVKPGVDYNPQTRLAMAGLSFSQRFFGAFQNRAASTPFWHPCGLLQLAWTAKEMERQRKFLARNQYPEQLLQPVTAAKASSLAGLPLAHPGLWYPGSGWVSPPALCHQLLLTPNIEALYGCNLTHLGRDGDEWRLGDDQGREWRAKCLVLCTGSGLDDLTAQAGYPLPLKTIRGQVTLVPAHLLNPTEAVLCADGYLNPPSGGEVLLGATFDLRDDDHQVRLSSHRENLERIGSWCPEAFGDRPIDPGRCLGRVGFRATLPDYQPVAGPLAPAGEGLFCLGALGSKGLALAPLLAEYVADCVSNQPPSLDPILAAKVDPRRFSAGNS